MSHVWYAIKIRVGIRNIYNQTKEHIDKKTIWKSEFTYIIENTNLDFLDLNL